MCGIVGVLTTENSTTQHPYVRFFQQALFADTLRGNDSTGVFLMNTKKQEEPEVWKKALAAPDFLQLSRTRNLLRDYADFNIMVGHNRAATKGGVNHTTAHPFQKDHITMVHNGTIYNHRSLTQGHQYDVDSEAICHAISVDGIESVVKKLDGAFTLVYHNGDDNTVNMIRNKERPLAIAKVKGFDTVVFSSEAPMLQWIAMRCGFSLDKIIEPEPGELFTFTPHPDINKWIAKAESRKLDLMPKKPITTYGGGYGGYYENGVYVGTSGTTTSKKGKGAKASSSSKTSETPSGTTTSTEQRRSTSNQLLLNIGLAPEDTVVLSDISWVPYIKAKGDRGWVVGTVDDLERDKVVGALHNVTKEEYDDMAGSYIYSGVQCAALDRETGRTVVYIDNQDFMVMEADDDDTVGTTVSHGSEDENTSQVYKVRGGEYVTLSTYTELTKDGCDYCGLPIDPVDHEKTGWDEDMAPVCKHCVKSMDLGQYL